MDHGTLLKELFDLVVAVPEWADKAGTNLGGNVPDPTLITLTPPACWVMFVSDELKDEGNERVVTQKGVYTFWFNSFIYLPVTNQQTHIQVDLPLLKKIITGVRGNESAANTGHRWAYRGQKLALVNTNRLVYAQRYSITGSM